MSRHRRGSHHDIVVYGATMPGVATVRAIAESRADPTSVLVIKPQPGIGGIGCAGGQNFWDVRPWAEAESWEFPQGGSFRRWFRTQGQAYDTDRMVTTLYEDLDHDGVTVRTRYDVEEVSLDADGRITAVHIRPLARTGGDTHWTGDRQVASGSVFIDASETGRLSRLVDVSRTVGRSDSGPDDRQMAATLMVQVEGIDWAAVREAEDPDGEPVFRTAVDGDEDKRLLWGGEQSLGKPGVSRFREAYPRLDIKALNAAEHDDGVFWLNALLIYDVDGRYDARERGRTGASGARDPWDRDRARRRATSAVDDAAFEAALAEFPGFEETTVRYEDGEPRVGDVLYVRETIHLLRDGSHEVEDRHAEDAGPRPGTGADKEFYESRIGLGYYWLDDNGYTRTATGADSSLEATDNPIFLPYEALTTPDCPNLLVPGYPVSIDSRAWSALRVLPNLCVLGDAAGVAAGIATESSVDPADFSGVQLERLQDRLRTDCDAILEKRALTGPEPPVRGQD